MYIGVAGYCVTPDAQYVNFTLTATLLRLKNDIFKIPQLNQLVAAKGANQYQFCVDKKVDVIAQMKSFTNACDCPNTYANLEYVISRTNANAGIGDLAWKIRSGQTTGIVKLLAQDNNTRPGTYFLNVLGSCNNPSECSSKCTCGPCANLANSKYALSVDYSTSSSNSSITIGSCPSAGDSTNTCAAFCNPGGIGGTTPTSPPSAPYALLSIDNIKKMNQGAVAGIAMLALVFLLGIVGCFLFCYRERLGLKCSAVSIPWSVASFIQPAFPSLSFSFFQILSYRLMLNLHIYSHSIASSEFLIHITRSLTFSPIPQNTTSFFMCVECSSDR